MMLGTEIVLKDVLHVTCSSAPVKGDVLETLKVSVEASTETYTVSVPVIVNTKRIDADQDVILKWQVPPKESKDKRQPTWVDAVANTEKKRRQDHT